MKIRGKKKRDKEQLEKVKQPTGRQRREASRQVRADGGKAPVACARGRGSSGGWEVK